MNGPGLRGVIWVQGCPIRCPDCFNRDLQDFRRRSWVEVDTLAERVLKIKGIEGVTFSGGEPFVQAAALGEVGRILQENGFNIVTFSGYPFEDLCRKNRSSWNSLLQVTDLLIAGPYDRARRMVRPFLGSSNQRLVFLTERLRGRIPAEPFHRDVEVRIDPDGSVRMTGFPEPDLLWSIRNPDPQSGEAYVTLQQSQNQN